MVKVYEFASNCVSDAPRTDFPPLDGQNQFVKYRAFRELENCFDLGNVKNAQLITERDELKKRRYDYDALKRKYDKIGQLFTIDFAAKPSYVLKLEQKFDNMKRDRDLLLNQFKNLEGRNKHLEEKIDECEKERRELKQILAMNHPDEAKNYKLDPTRAWMEIIYEYRSAIEMHEPFNTPHEGYAVIKEELDELWWEVRHGDEDGATARMRTEAKQVAAMALRFMGDLTRVPEKKNDDDEEAEWRNSYVSKIQITKVEKDDEFSTDKIGDVLEHMKKVMTDENKKDGD